MSQVFDMTPIQSTLLGGALSPAFNLKRGRLAQIASLNAAPLKTTVQGIAPYLGKVRRVTTMTLPVVFGVESKIPPIGNPANTHWGSPTLLFNFYRNGQLVYTAPIGVDPQYVAAELQASNTYWNPFSAAAFIQFNTPIAIEHGQNLEIGVELSISIEATEPRPTSEPIELIKVLVGLGYRPPINNGVYAPQVNDSAEWVQTPGALGWQEE